MAEKYIVDKFDGSDFGFWKMQIEDYLYGRDLFLPAYGEKPEAVKEEEWKLLDRKAMSAVRLTLSKQVAQHTTKAKNTKELLETLSGLYEKPSAINKVHLIKRLVNLKMDEVTSADKHIGEFNMILGQLESVEMTFDDEVQACILLSTLPESWNQTVTAVSATAGKEKLKLSDVRDLIISEDTRRKESGTSNSSGGSALSAGSRGGRSRCRSGGKSDDRFDMSKVRCWKCDGLGHMKKDCKVPTVNAATEDVGEALFLSACGRRSKSGHRRISKAAAGCRSQGEELSPAELTVKASAGSSAEEKKFALVTFGSGGSAMIPDNKGVKESEPKLQRYSKARKFDSKKAWTVGADSSKASWVLDSGASFHLCGDAGAMEDHTAGSFGKVYQGDGTALKVAGRGSARIKGGNGYAMQVRDVRHVPGLRNNLLSVGQLDKEGYEITFGCGRWKIVKGARVIAQGQRQGTMYTMGTVRKDVKAAGAGRSDASTWRCGGSNHGNQKLRKVRFGDEELKSCATSAGPEA